MRSNSHRARAAATTAPKCMTNPPWRRAISRRERGHSTASPRMPAGISAKAGAQMKTMERKTAIWSGTSGPAGRPIHPVTIKMTNVSSDDVIAVANIATTAGLLRPEVFKPPAPSSFGPVSSARSGIRRAQRLCQLKKSRSATAEPRNSGIEKRNPGDPAMGRMFPHFVQLVIQNPPWPPNASGSTKARIAPRNSAGSHLILGHQP